MSWMFRDYEQTHDRTALDDILARSRDIDAPDEDMTGWHLINANTTVARWVRDDDPLHPIEVQS